MIHIEIDASEVLRGLANLNNQLAPAVAKGLTRTMRAVEQHELQAMETQIDRPTPFTLDSLWLQPARPEKLETTLGIKPVASRYLVRPILGGDVDNTLVPVLGNVKLNPYGNIIAKRRGMKYLAKREKRGFVARIKGTLAVWQRLDREHVRVLIYKDPEAPRDKRWTFYETGDKVIRARVLRDLRQAIRDTWR